ncbi:MAG: ATP-binding protein [Lentimicrobiaceae bacterium]|nr:ATP-binding protein [Lentimicrobiaceae bacterium]
MLYRKIEKEIKEHLENNANTILIVEGARQVGKSFIIRKVAQELFKNYIEINFAEDKFQSKTFEQVSSVQDFYMKLSSVAGERMNEKNDTIIFLDEIQEYPQFLTLLKFLNQDNKFTFIASGSLLGITLNKTTSIPLGSILIKKMYPLDFEEFIIANGFGNYAIEAIRNKFLANESLDEGMHNRMISLFKNYLLVGGMPQAVNVFIATNNIMKVREVHTSIHELYGIDAAKYDKENRLKIQRIYSLIPSFLENKKKRVVIKDIEDIKGKRFDNYRDEFDYLIQAGVALEVKAISNPIFPLIESAAKNLLKLYFNDIGLLTNVLYRNNIMAVLNEENSVNLGSVYESVVAQELKAHNKNLFYYDNKNKGEVDYLIDDYDNLSVLPIEVKSGKDYYVHTALNHFVSNEDYRINKAIVLSNERNVIVKDKIFYMPIYYSMFL